MTGKETLNIVKQKPNVFISCGCCKSIANKAPSYCCCTQDQRENGKDEKNIFINHITEYLHKISLGKPNQLMNTKYSIEKEDEFEYSKAIRNVKLKCALNCFGIQNKEPNIIIENKVLENSNNIEQEINKQNFKGIEDKKCLHVNINFVNEVNLPGSVCCTCNNKGTQKTTSCNCNIELQEENFKALFPSGLKGSGAQYCVVISPEGETTIFYQEHAKKGEHTKKSEKKKKIARDMDAKSESEESFEEEEEISQDEGIDDKSVSKSDVEHEIKEGKTEDISDSLTDLEKKEKDNKLEETGDDEKTRQSKTDSKKRETIEKEAENETLIEAESGENKEVEDTFLDPGKESLTGDTDEDSPLEKSLEQIEEKYKTESDDRKKEDEGFEEIEDSGPKSETYLQESSTEDVVPDEKKKEIAEDILEQGELRGTIDEDKLDIDEEVETIKSDERKTEGTIKSVSKSGKSLESSQDMKQTMSELSKSKASDMSELSKSKASDIYSLAAKSIESAKKNWTKDTEYLENEVGRYLIKSMAEIGFVQPSDPINYLGERLYKYREMEDYRLVADDEKEDLLFNKEMFEMTKQKVKTFSTLKRHRHKVEVIDVIPEENKEGEQVVDDPKQEEIKNETDMEISAENGITELPEDQVN